MASNVKDRKEPGWKSKATKAKIKKAALKIFAKRGYSDASIRLIAKQSKTNIALISQYFGGKEQLFKDVIQESTRDLASGELDYPSQDSLRKEVESYIYAMFDNLERNLDFFRIVASQSLVDRKFSVFLKQTIIIQEDARLIARLRVLREKKLIRDNVSARDLALNISSFVTGHSFYSLLLFGESKVPLRESIEKFLDFICLSADH